MPTLEMIPTKQIVAGENPRGKIDTKGEAFKELCDSISARGILQPILVAPADGKKKHTIIAGHRRHAAAAKLKLPDVPTMVTDAAAGDLIASLTENIQREDLSPVAEAKAIRELQDHHGFTQVEAGKALSKSERWVRERLRLLGLPEKTQQAYDAGALPLESLVTVEKLAQQAPKAAEALAETAATDEEIRAAVGGARLGDAFGIIAEREYDVDVGCLLGVQRHFGRIDLAKLERCGATKEQLDAAKNAIAATKVAGTAFHKAGGYFYGRDADEAQLKQNDLDEADAFGCLLEVNGSFYVTDVAWLADRYVELQKREEQGYRDKIKNLKPRGKGADPAKSTPSDDEKEQKRREREEEDARRIKVRANNLELGQRAQKAFDKPKISLEEGKLLALMLVGNNESSFAARGLKYCYHEYQEQTTLKNGRVKVDYDGGAAKGGADLLAAIRGAKTAEEAIGAAVRAAVLSVFADETCVAPSSRANFSIRYGNDEEVIPLLEAIAEARNVLPEAVQAEVAERKALEAERRELYMLLTVKRSRAKDGISHEDLIDRSQSTTLAMVEAAVQSRHLKERETGDHFTYTLTGVGAKRLEKLGRAEKERNDS